MKKDQADKAQVEKAVVELKRLKSICEDPATARKESMAGVTRKEAMQEGMRYKLKWLNEYKKLPLPPHQAHGTLFVKNKRVKDGYNPKTKETVKSLRSVIQTVTDKYVIDLLRTDTLIPADEEFT
jgi:hypothetical protein